MRKVALSFLAHPDDAEILCAGTLIFLRDAGWAVHIATATPGECEMMDLSRWAIAAERTEEAASAASIIGATYHCIDERDGLVVNDKLAIQKTVDLFRRVAPSLVFAHAPRDYKMDHEEASKLARAASFIYGAPNISTVPRHPEFRVPYLYYCDPVEGTDPMGHPVTPTTIIDISGQVERKLDVLAQHASQREWLRAHHRMDEYLESTMRRAAARGKEAGVAFAEGFV